LPNTTGFCPPPIGSWIFVAIPQLKDMPQPAKKKIGFLAKEKRAAYGKKE
jgi:hypothetical protein